MQQNCNMKKDTSYRMLKRQKTNTAKTHNKMQNPQKCKKCLSAFKPPSPKSSRPKAASLTNSSHLIYFNNEHSQVALSLVSIISKIEYMMILYYGFFFTVCPHMTL